MKIKCTDIDHLLMEGDELALATAAKHAETCAACAETLAGWNDISATARGMRAAWHNDMKSVQGFLNYSQAWSLAAFMFNQGVKGKKFFNQIFNLSVRMGGDTKTYFGVKKRGWEEAFSRADREELEKAWVEWVKKVLPKDERVPKEETYLLRIGLDPDSDTILPLSEKELGERMAKLKPDSAKKGKGKEGKEGKTRKKDDDDSDGE